MDGSSVTYRVRETLLSRKPRADSVKVATLCFTVVLTVSLLAWSNGSALVPALAATQQRILEGGEYWRLVTAVAIHGDLLHLLSNVFFLAFLAYLLFGYFGFWVFPVLSLAMAGLTNYLALLTYPPGVSLVGASGMVYWMAGFWLSMYMLVERSVGPGKRMIRATVVGLFILFPSTFDPGISYRTHAIGLALGVMSAVGYFLFYRRAIRALEVVELEEEDPLDY